MNNRDDFFYQAVIYAKEKNYSAARAMLRNLLYQYPDDIEGLLLYSIVAKNKYGSIQALKRILVLNPDHEIAFQKLAALKNAPTSESIPTPTAPTPSPTALKTRTLEPSLVPPPVPTPVPVPTPPSTSKITRPPSPKAPEEMIERKKLEPSQTIEQKKGTQQRRRKKKNLVDMILIGLLILTCLCVSVAAVQQLLRYFLAAS